MSGIRSWVIELFKGEPQLSIESSIFGLIIFMAGRKLIVIKFKWKDKKILFSLFKYKWFSDWSRTVMTDMAWGVFSLLFVFSHAALALLFKTAKLGSLCETNLAFCIIIFKLKGIVAGEGSEKNTTICIPVVNKPSERRTLI